MANIEPVVGNSVWITRSISPLDPDGYAIFVRRVNRAERNAPELDIAGEYYISLAV